MAHCCCPERWLTNPLTLPRNNSRVVVDTCSPSCRVPSARSDCVGSAFQVRLIIAARRRTADLLQRWPQCWNSLKTAESGSMNP